MKDDSQTQIFATKQMKISANINPEWDITGARECFCAEIKLNKCLNSVLGLSQNGNLTF